MAKRNSGEKNTGRFAYEGLDRVMHEKARLGILTSLVTHPDGLVFNELKGLCALTDGNLSRHLQLLEEGKLVEVTKGYDGKKPQTVCRMTAEGRKRFLAYLEELEKVVRDASVEDRQAARGKKPGEAWNAG